MHFQHQTGKTHKEAIFPLSIILRGKLAVVILTTIPTGFVFILVLIFLPERFQIVQLNDPIAAGVHLLPLLCSVAVGSAICGLANIRKNNTFWTLTIGSAFILQGCGLLSTAENSFQVPHREFGYQVIFGFGVGFVFATASIIVSWKYWR